MRFTDRSRRELEWYCPRARYWGYEWEGIGLASLEPNKDLQFGGAMADQQAQIKKGEAFALDAFPTDQRPLAHALLSGYRDIVWPRWMRDFDVVSIEEEQPLPLTEWLTYNSRPDTITQRKSDHTYWYGPEDKTTAWVDSIINYANSIQLHATAVAIEANKGIRISGCVVQGLYKGYEREGKLNHPLVYAYRKEGMPGVVPDQWNVKWTRGWERTPIAEYPGGVAGWLKKIGPEELAGVFPQSEPITLKRELVAAYLAQTVQRESEIEQWRRDGRQTDDATLGRVFPQSFNQCDGFGKGRKPCPFKEGCFNATAKKFPLSFYKHREPHHANEKTELAAL